MDEEKKTITPKATADGVPVYCSHDAVVDTIKMVPNPANPNKHPDDQIKLLAKIIKASGWRQPITVSKRSGFIVKGHGRLMAAQLAGFKQVPVDYQEYASEAEEYADLIADNRIAELAEIDQKMLADIFAEIDTGEIDLDQTGYTDQEVEQLVTSLAESLHQELDVDSNANDAPEAPAEPVTQYGDIWILGDNRVMCGNSTSKDDRALLLDGAAPEILLTDAVKYTDAWCATTVSAASIACGLTDIMPTECGCDAMIKLYQNLGRWEENDAYRPSPGDVVFYDWDDNGIGDNRGSSDHVGVVDHVSGNTITIIEGNKSNAVGTREIQVNGKYIRGYGLPNYASKATSESHTEKPATLKHKAGDIVKFTGSTHYKSSDASSGVSCKAGTAKITAVFEKGKHPYHLIAEKGGGSTVYGWVDAKDIGETSQAAPAASASFSVGDKVKVRGSVHCYGNGSGGDANRDGSTMYVVGLVSSKTYKYYIGVADKKGGARIGWAEPSQLSHC